MKVFICIEHSGSYDDYRTTNEVAFKSKEDAEKWVKKIESRNRLTKSLHREFEAMIDRRDIFLQIDVDEAYDELCKDFKLRLKKYNIKIPFHEIENFHGEDELEYTIQEMEVM